MEIGIIHREVRSLGKTEQKDTLNPNFKPLAFHNKMQHKSREENNMKEDRKERKRELLLLPRASISHYKRGVEAPNMEITNTGKA